MIASVVIIPKVVGLFSTNLNSVDLLFLTLPIGSPIISRKQFESYIEKALLLQQPIQILYDFCFCIVHMYVFNLYRSPVYTVVRYCVSLPAAFYLYTSAARIVSKARGLI